MTISVTYNKFTADELRLLLTQIDVFDKEVSEISLDLSLRQHEYTKINQAEICWAHLYEKSFKECLALFFVLNGLSKDIKSVAKSKNKIQALNKLADKIDPHLDSILDGIKNNDDQKQFITLNASLSLLYINSMRSQMIYGHYINYLIANARESSDSKLADKTLLQAIRIDASVVGCPTALRRISRAVFLVIVSFLTKSRMLSQGK